MSIPIPFEIINWNDITKEEHAGHFGTSYWRTRQYDGLRIRLVEYTIGYLADHWCTKGHVIYCVQGSFVTEMITGEKFLVKQGESYVVSDELSTHRSFTEEGVQLLIVDGDFLKRSLAKPETNFNDLPAE